MPFLHIARRGCARLDKVTLAAALNVDFTRSRETASTQTNEAFVTFAGAGFEAPRLPC